MNNKDHYVIFGGAGFAGTFIVFDIIKRYPNAKVTVVTRNLTKQIFFRNKNVKVINDIGSIHDTDLKIINLAFSLAKTFNETNHSNNNLFKTIDQLISKNRVSAFVHISTIVLTQTGGMKVSKIKKDNMYSYSKIIGENHCKKIAEKHKIPVTILRSGNILGPGSPWVDKIARRLIAKQPILGKAENYPSNTTFIGNLSFVIISLSNRLNPTNKLQIINFCEFGDVSWHKWVFSINKCLNKEIVFWPLKSLKQIKRGLFNDIKYVIKQGVSYIVPIAYKTKDLKIFLLKFIDLLKVKQAENKAKITVQNIEARNLEYYDNSEYSLQGVFMFEKKYKLENLPEEIKSKLPYNYDAVVNSINNWLKYSGYSNL